MRILVMTDFSKGANRALDFVLEHFPMAQTKLLHVVDIAGLPEVNVNPLGRGRIAVAAMQTQQDLQSEAQKKLEALGGGETAFGHPVEIGLEVAESWQATLIALGTAGKRGLERLLMGSVAEEIARRAPIPVLIVGAEDRI